MATPTKQKLPVLLGTINTSADRPIVRFVREGNSCRCQALLRRTVQCVPLENLPTEKAARCATSAQLDTRAQANHPTVCLVSQAFFRTKSLKLLAKRARTGHSHCSMQQSLVKKLFLGRTPRAKTSFRCIVLEDGAWAVVVGRKLLVAAEVWTTRMSVLFLVCPFVCVRFQNSSNASSCYECAIGRFTNTSGQSVCRHCPRGAACIDKGANPVDCSPGFFAFGQDFTSCLLCPVGWFALENASTKCDECPAGHMCPAGDIAPIECGPGMCVRAA